MFCFVGYFYMHPFRRTLEKKSTKTSRNFQRNIWSSSFSFFMPKQQPCPHSNLKNIFSLSSNSDKMSWERAWPKQLYVLFIVKTWNFTERHFSKDLSYLLFKGQVYKNISRYYDKDFKITSFGSNHRRCSLRKGVLRNFTTLVSAMASECPGVFLWILRNF